MPDKKHRKDEERTRGKEGISKKENDKLINKEKELEQKERFDKKVGQNRNPWRPK